MRRTKEEAALTRQHILEAAEELFFREGFDGASLDRIAEAAGVKRGAVHFHFTNKIGILLTLAEREVAALLELVDRIDTDARLDPLAALADFCAATIEGLAGDPKRRAIIRAMMLVDLRTDEADEEKAGVIGFDSRLFAAERRILAAAAARGRLGGAWTVVTATAVLHAFMCGLVTSWSKRNEPHVQLVPDGVNAARQLIGSFGGQVA